jgi:hypothetical protein
MRQNVLNRIDLKITIWACVVSLVWTWVEETFLKPTAPVSQYPTLSQDSPAICCC